MRKENMMGLKTALIDTLFGGRRDPFTSLQVLTDDNTNPTGVTTAPIGTFLIVDYNGDDADNDVWLNTDGSTAWLLVYDASSSGHLY